MGNTIRHRFGGVTLLAAFILQLGTLLGAETSPPRAKVVPHRLEEHGNVRVDDYYWLRERANPDVLSYLEAENAYTAAVMAPTEDLQKELFDEIVSRIEPNDDSVPYELDGYFYYERYVEGGEYKLYCRKKGSLEAGEEVLLDGNELARGNEFFSIFVDVSPRHDRLVYATDTVGRRIYSLRFKNLETGATSPEIIRNVTGNVAWANDGVTLFYSRQDPETLRSFQVYRHRVGGDPALDPLVYEEKDEAFDVYVTRTKSRRYVLLTSYSTLATEVRSVSADAPEAEPAVFLPRRRGHEYEVDHVGDQFYIRTNDGARNFRLMATPVKTPARENWREIVGSRDDVLLEGMEVFEDYLVLAERAEGLLRLHVLPRSGAGDYFIDFDEPAYVVYPERNPDIGSKVLRFRYSSLKTPPTVYDYDLETRKRTMRKQDVVRGGFSPDDYRVERLYAPARDGQSIPISLVYRDGLEKNGRHPLLLYAYGSYGYSTDAEFDAPTISLLDRGFVYAIAHVRGGQERGRAWYEDGKLLHKKNTVFDFIDGAEYLIERGYTSKDRLFAQGASAGGLLMGAIVNYRPDLFRGVEAGVPFVDVVTTMLDPSIPLTAGEYDEWGNPNEKEYYDYMLSYSPYDNVEAKDYPHLLVTTAFHDSQVQYFEPAKWVAKLRAKKTDANRLLLYTNMEAGHGGSSGRYQRHKETALWFAFALSLVDGTP
jgi:oligopeptidase B